MAKFGMNLTEGSVTKNLIRFSLPIFLSLLLQQLYNSCDTIVVGRLVSDTALAAVGSTSALTTLILNIFVGLSIGSNVVCAKANGAGDNEQIERTVHTSILLGLLSGVVVAVVGFFCSNYFLFCFIDNFSGLFQHIRAY